MERPATGLKGVLNGVLGYLAILGEVVLIVGMVAGVLFFILLATYDGGLGPPG